MIKDLPDRFPVQTATEEQILAPKQMGSGLFTKLRRLAYQHRHDFHYLRRIQWELIERYLRPGQGEYILDVASGDGYYSRKMASRGAKVEAIDIDPERIRNARTYHGVPNVHYRLGNAEMLPYEDASFDKVVSVCALEHFHDPQQAINEAYRVVKPGGRLVLHVDSFTYREITDEIRAYHRKHYYVENYFTIESLAKLLRNAGFEVNEHRYSFNSPLSHRFFQWGEKRGFTGVKFLLMFPVGYALCKLGDRFTGKPNEGYDLYVRAAKPRA
jgi:ubiquinone/menaquinone biosynthesis C-methylase UbiE